MMTATKGGLLAVLEDSFGELVSTLQTVPIRSTSISIPNPTLPDPDQSMSPKIALLRKRFRSLSLSGRSDNSDSDNVEGDVFSNHLEKPWQSPLTKLPLNRVCRNASSGSSSPKSYFRRLTLTPSFEEYSIRAEQVQVVRNK